MLNAWSPPRARTSSSHPGQLRTATVIEAPFARNRQMFGRTGPRGEPASARPPLTITRFATDTGPGAGPGGSRSANLGMLTAHPTSHLDHVPVCVVAFVLEKYRDRG